MRVSRRSVLKGIAVGIAGALLAACQPKATPTEAPVAGEPAAEQPASEAAAGEPAAPEATELTVWDFGGSEFAWMDSIAIGAFNEVFPNIKINHVGVPEEEISLKLETAITAGAVPDLALGVSGRVVKAGHVVFLDEYMVRDDISRDDYGPLFVSGNVMDDKVFSLPMDANIWAMMYNKDLFAEAGLPELGPDDVITYDDWLVYARAINKPAETLEGRVWGSVFFWPRWNSMNNYMSDPYVLGADGRTCLGSADNEHWIHFWEIMKQAYDENVTTETAGALLSDVEEDMFTQGKLGMSYATLGDAVFAQRAGVNVGLTGQPVVTPGWKGNVGGWTTSYGIMTGTKSRDQAWEFLKWLSVEALKVVPLGTDALDAGAGGGVPGLPCYLPLHEFDSIAMMSQSEPVVADSV
ncbi:MAG: substrate-binding domain-containing protein [Anaerolineales bacterium]